MHQELIDELRGFAIEYNLRFDYNFDAKTNIYKFRIGNKEHTWLCEREFAQQQLDLFNGSTAYFARGIIDDVRKSIMSLSGGTIDIYGRS
jgi:hypothetical protein